MMMMTGKQFRKWRRMMDLTQSEIAKEINVDRSVISKFENEKIDLYRATSEKLMKFVLEH